jgi:4-amino-4-deoxy-L-arabinose transferase-like glycosyltransferase
MKSISLTKLEAIFLSAIILVGSFLRLYKIQETAMFLGDQGRDAIIAKNILKERDIALIGPVTSVGNMYLGPFYYYFMVPWLALTYPNPIGPAIGVALVGAMTIPLLYFITRKLFSKSSATIATILFTVSSLITQQVRFSWNPNIAPTVGLLIFYFMSQVVLEKKYRSLIWATIAFSIIVQLHYIALLTGGFIASIVIYEWIKNKQKRKEIFINSFISIGIFLISLVPLYVFNKRHNDIIVEGFSTFFTSTEQHILPAKKLLLVVSNFSGSFYKIIPQMLGSVLQTTHKLISIIVVGLTLLFCKKSNTNQKQSFSILAVWVGVAVIALSLYTSSIFTHYLSFSQAVSMIVVGVLLGYSFDHIKITKPIIIFCIMFFSYTNIKDSQALSQGSNHIAKAQKTSESILERVDSNEKYNLVLISETGDIDAQNYRYFLETSTKPPVLKENRGEVEKLFIVQESYFDANPVDSPIYEIVVFPNKTPKEVYTVENGPIITLLEKNDHQ